MPLLTLAAPTPATPVNAITVNDWCTPAADCVLDTVTLVNAAGAEVVQISATPNCVFARARRVHVRPAPAIVSVCAFGAAGPSDAANATSTSPAAGVLETAGPCPATASQKKGPSSVRTPRPAGTPHDAQPAPPSAQPPGPA